jgi:uridine kinase
MKNIILISGKQGSGKTTLANNIEKLFNQIAIPKYVVLQVKFADVIYEMHDSIWEILNKYGFKNPQAKSGDLLQYLGLQFGRKVLGEDVWAKVCRTKTDNILKHPNYLNINLQPIVIIDDLRFINEFDIFPDAFRVRLECPEDIRKVRCSAWRENTTHPSEIDLDDYSIRGKFDLYFDTERANSEECAKYVLENINREYRAI